MALDGVTVAAIRSELAHRITGGKITKIIQPEADEILLAIHTADGNCRLALSARAALPLAYLTDEARTAPLAAPNFCMLLRKHIGGGRIAAVEQPGLERILHLRIAHRDEMGDPIEYRLILELMGKYSNLILVNARDEIVDAIKRIPSHISSVREVLPGRPYFVPDAQHKRDPLTITDEAFLALIRAQAMPLSKALYGNLTGVSPQLAEEICYRAEADGGRPAEALDDASASRLLEAFRACTDAIRAEDFSCAIYYRDDAPAAFYVLPLAQYADCRAEAYPSVSELLVSYYAAREKVSRIRQKSVDLRKLVTTLTERAAKKLQLQEKQLRDTADRDKYRIYGEMLNTYGYSLPEGADKLEAVNYYDNTNVTIPLDPTLGVSGNANRYFNKYTKMKRTAEDLGERIKETASELAHLQSIGTSLDLAESEADLAGIREELSASGYIRGRGNGRGKTRSRAAAPLHFRSSDGCDIYVGKNNLQNEHVSFEIASGNDWWFHAKNMPGSHVVVRCPDGDPPDATFEEAGRLAAYYSSGRTASKVEIDYTQKKNLRKPGGAKPGFVVYYTNYSLMSVPDISGILRIPDAAR